MNVRSIKTVHITFIILLISVALTAAAFLYWNSTTGQINMDNSFHQKNNHTHRHRVTLNGDSFVGDLLDVLYRFNDFHGIEIELEGFIYRKEKHDKNKFTIARMLMTCCEEDTEILGLLSYYDGEEELTENTWVRIKGKLQSIEQVDESTKRMVTQPIIIIETLEEIEEPEDPYIYP